MKARSAALAIGLAASTLAGLIVPAAVGTPDWVGFASAEPAPARIGILHPGTARSSEPSRVTILRTALRELGYVEGRDFSIEARYADGQPDRLPKMAAELVRKRVDVIVASGFAIAAAQKARRPSRSS